MPRLAGLASTKLSINKPVYSSLFNPLDARICACRRRRRHLILALKLGPADASVFHLGADNGQALCHAVDDELVFLDGVDAVLVWLCAGGSGCAAERDGCAFCKGLELVVGVLEVGDGVADFEDFEVKHADGEVFDGGGEAGG